HLARWTGRQRADGRIESRFNLAVETDSGGLRTLAGTLDALGGVGEVRVPGFHAALRPSDGLIQLDTLMLRSNVALVDGSGSVQLRSGPDPAPLRLVATLGDLGPVTALMGADTAGADSGRITLTVAGPPSGRLVEAAGDAYGLAYGRNLANHLT